MIETLDDSSFVVLVTLIISNLSYLLPAWIAWNRRLYDIAGLLTGMSIISSIHHACFDAGVCIGGASSAAISNLDVAYAIVACGIIIMSIAIYDVIRVKYSNELMANGYSINTYVDNILVVYAVSAIYISLVVGIHVGLYWHMKRKTWRVRFFWPYVILAMLLAGFSIILFAYLERSVGKRILHSLWHITSAISSALLLAGTAIASEDL